MRASHRRPSTTGRHAVRRSVAAAALAVATIAGFLVVTPAVASAATTWFVAVGGNATAACPGTSVAPCANVTLVLNKAAFASGDTINVGAGSYADHPVIAAKGANIVGANKATTFFDGSTNSWAIAANTANVVSSISNVTIRNGGPVSSLGGLGGGLLILGAKVTTNNVDLTNNKAVQGGGAYVGVASSVGGSLNMTGGTVSGNSNAPANALNEGGGIAVVTGSLTTSNVTFSGNSSLQSGGGVYIGANSTLSMTGGSMTTNSAAGTSSASTAGGGALYVAGTGSGSVSGTSFSSNTITGAQAFGSAAYVAANATLTTGAATFNANNATGTVTGGAVAAFGTVTDNGSTFTNNVFTGANSLGGALSVLGTMTLNGTSLSGNKSPFGGAGLVFQGASLNVHNATVSGNSAPAAGVALSGGGGGFYVVGKAGATPGGVLTIDGTTSFTGNTATGATSTAAGNGGAIFNAGTTSITGGTFSANQAVATTATANPRRGQGGAIFNGGQDGDDTPSLTLNGTSITGGLPAGQFNASSGGGIANADNLGTTAATSPTLTATNVTLTGGTAIAGGDLYQAGTATVTGGTIRTGNAWAGGGVYQAPLVVPGSNPTSTFDGTAFLGNVADSGAVANLGHGGAIFNTSKLTVKNATFTGNQATASTAASTATGWGGAIYSGPFAANDAPDLTITNTVINGGTTTAGSNAVVGGAIANVGNTFGFGGTTPGKLTATGLTLSKNTALAAGGLYSGGNATLTGSTIDQNAATHASLGFGGGVYAARGAGDPAPVVTLNGTAVTANTAAVLGGGATVGFGATLNLGSATQVNGNSAIAGAGIANSGTTTATSASVNGNHASYQGGGIYNGSSTATDTPVLTLTDTKVDTNDAANSGGGLVTVAGATLTATGGEVNGNSAVGGGGLVVGDGAPASFTSTDFVGNTATASVGGAIVNAGKLSLANATINGNHAVHTTGNVGLGGAIYSGSNADGATTTLTIDASTISGNDAWAGAALVTYSPGDGATNTTSIDRSTISGNVNGTNVGAIEQFHPLTITNSTITGNTATGGVSGGLFMVDPAHVGVAGTIFSGNSTSGCTGAPVDGGYNLADTGDTSCGFTAAKHDVAGNPQLGALANNGGDTPTQLPSASSPALDKIPAGTATGLTNVVTTTAVTLCGAGAADQRGTSRPQGAKCDIGAVERAQVAPTVDGPATADYSVGNAGTPLVYTTTGSPQPTLSASALPSGVTFHDNGDGTGTIAGTPGANTGGDYTITITATNEAGSDSTDLALTIHQAPLLGGPDADTYTVGVAGGPDVFTMTSGHPDAVLSTTSPLPAGVTFTPGPHGTATIQGTPLAGTGGVYVINITGTNGTPPDGTHTFTLTVKEAPTIAGPAADTATVGTAHASAEFTTTGYPAATLSSTDLPAGLSVTSTGPGKAKITGTPANGTGGTYTVHVKASNGTLPDAVATVALTVKEAPEITGATTARFIVGTANSVGFSADGYPQAGLTISGPVPAGLSFTDNGNGTATLSGTATGPVGVSNVTITASNGVNPDAVLHVAIDVVPPVEISTTSLAGGSVGTAYSQSVMAIGGLPPYTFTLVSGSLPAGLTLAPNGTISGTPTGPTGLSSFTVKVTDSSTPAQTDTQALSITIGKGTTTLAVEPVLINAVNILGIKVNLGYVSATLTGGDPAHGIAGQTIVFKAGATTVCTAVTDANGKAVCAMNVANTLVTILNLGVTGSYGGNALWNGSSGSAGLLLL